MVDRRGTLPGVGSGVPDQIVLHVDIDCFYAACERRREPALRGEPVVVGMGYEPGTDAGAVATASYEAREYGVESARAISAALERLPRKIDAIDDPELDLADAGFYRPVDMEFYEAVAADVKTVLYDVGDTVRDVSIDEAYVDVTDRVEWDGVAALGRRIKRRIADEASVTASVGAAPTMSAAKIASDHDKPDGLVVVRPDEITSFLAPLPVEAVHGVGPVRARELAGAGIETAGDLAAADPARLTDRFGSRGRDLVARARGQDDRTVTPRGRPKSFSRESAYGDPVTDPERKRKTVGTLADAVTDRARREGALYRTVGVKAVEPPFEVSTRERSLPGPVDDPALATELALSLFDEFDDRSIRKVGVRLSNLVFAPGDQTSLDSWSDPSGTDPSTADDTPETDGRSGDSAHTGPPPGAAERAETRTDTLRRDGQTELDAFVPVDPGDDD
ncbi:DNA polymerase IV [Halobacteriales archaeon SW_7_68_16]|nr:MAG: DNA polymerase IV [Halobacteriales archaeon SW_7_68_16]